MTPEEHAALMPSREVGAKCLACGAKVRPVTPEDRKKHLIHMNQSTICDHKVDCAYIRYWDQR